MRSRISIRGCVRPSVGPSVRPSVRRSVGHTRVETTRKCRFWPKLLSVRARTHLMAVYPALFLPKAHPHVSKVLTQFDWWFFFHLFSIIRVYYDRLIDNPDQKWFMNEIKKVFIRHFGEDFDKVFAHLDQGGKGSIDETDIRSDASLWWNHVSCGNWTRIQEWLVWCHFVLIICFK